MSKTRKNKMIWFHRGALLPYIGFCSTKKAWKKMLKDLDLPNIPYATEGVGMCTWLENEEKHQDYIIITIPDERHDEMYKTDTATRRIVDGLIVHEVTHMFEYITKVMKEKEPSSEFRAYHMQYLFESTQRAYEKCLKV